MDSFEQEEFPIDEEPVQQDEEFDYEEDLMDDYQLTSAQPQQGQKAVNFDKKEDPKREPPRRMSTPYVQKNSEEELEEEGEVYVYDDEDENFREEPANEEILAEDNEYQERPDEEEAYGQDYDEDFEPPEENARNSKKTQSASQNQASSRGDSVNASRQKSNHRPAQVKKAPLPVPVLRPKLTYAQKYADSIKEINYDAWSFKDLEMENQQLRQMLKEINKEVQVLVEERDKQKPLIVQAPPKKAVGKPPVGQRADSQERLVEGKGNVILKEIENNQKKLKNQEEEIARLERKRDQLENPEYVPDLDKRTADLENKIRSLQNQIKKEQQELKQKGKKLDEFENNDLLEKMRLEKNRKTYEKVKAIEKKDQLQQQGVKQDKQIANYLSDISKLDYELRELESQALELRVDSKNSQQFNQKQEKYNKLVVEKELLEKHKVILEKKDAACKQIEKDIHLNLKEANVIDKEINDLQIEILEQKKTIDQLKSSVPPKAFKNLPAYLTQENINSAMREEKNKESLRKLQSAKPGQAGKPELVLQSTPQSQQPDSQAGPQVAQQAPKGDQPKLPPKSPLKPKVIQAQRNDVVEEDIKVEEEIVEDNSKAANTLTFGKGQKISDAQKPPLAAQPQNSDQQAPNDPTKQNASSSKMNSKPFTFGKKQQPDASTQQQAPVQADPLVSNSSNVSMNSQVPSYNNEEQKKTEQSQEYTGPSRMMRMVRRPQQQQQTESEYQLNQNQASGPQAPSESKQPQPSEFKQPVEQPDRVDDYQPTFQSRRGRMKNVQPAEEKEKEQAQGIPVSDYMITTTGNNENNRRRKVNVLDAEPQKQPEQEPQTYTFAPDQGANNRRRGRGAEQGQQTEAKPEEEPWGIQQKPAQEPQKEFNFHSRRNQNTLNEAPKDEPAVQQQPPKEQKEGRQEPGKLNNQRRGKNGGKLSLWDEQPTQKENIQEIPEVADYTKEPEPKFSEPVREESAFDQIYGQAQKPVQQRRRFEVPREEEEYKPSMGNQGRTEKEAKADKSRDLAMQAKNKNILDDFDF